DQALPCAILYSLECGLQHSVVRRQVFERLRFCTEFRNEAEDQLTVIRALAHAFHYGYLTDVHVDYYIHDDNSSAAGYGGSVDKRQAVFQGLITGFERLSQQVCLATPARRALNQRLAKEYFWHLGYAILWNSGRRKEALSMFRLALRHWPW